MIKNILAEKMAGEITLSPKPGQTIRKWREIFGISQTDLAHFLELSPSVICDYESGRRKSPGIQNIRKVVGALLEIDEKKNNAKILHRYQSFDVKKNDGILDIMEYSYGITTKQFIKEIDGELLTSDSINLKKDVNGFTLLDSVKTITMLNSSDYAQLYGWSTDRALIFTGVRFGRSPMIAIRIHPVKPSVVVYHKPHDVDSLAVELAEREKIPLVVTNSSLNSLRKKLIMLKMEQ